MLIQYPQPHFFWSQPVFPAHGQAGLPISHGPWESSLVSPPSSELPPDSSDPLSGTHLSRGRAKSPRNGEQAVRESIPAPVQPHQRTALWLLWVAGLFLWVLTQSYSLVQLYALTATPPPWFPSPLKRQKGFAGPWVATRSFLWGTPGRCMLSLNHPRPQGEACPAKLQPI